MKTAYALVLKRNPQGNRSMDGELKKGDVESIHLFKRVAELNRHPDWHTIKKIRYEII